MEACSGHPHRAFRGQLKGFSLGNDDTGEKDVT